MMVLRAVTLAGNAQLSMDVLESHFAFCTNAIGVTPTVPTDSMTVVLWVALPPAPVIVSAYVPVAVPDATAKVAVEVPLPGAAMVAGLKLTVTPAGWPLAVSDTELLNPFSAVVVIVDVPLLPAATLSELGVAAMVKSVLEEIADSVDAAIARDWGDTFPAASYAETE
jgi:hypothetical protein